MMDLQKALFTEVLLLALVTPLAQKSEIAQEPSLDHCQAPPVIEGETGAMTFDLRGIDVNSDSLFLSLTRENDQLTKILYCRRAECVVNIPAFKTGGIVDTKLEIKIERITKDFQDNYFLGIHTSGDFKETYVCRLAVNKRKDTDKPTSDKNTTVMIIADFVVVAVLGITAGVIMH